MSEAESDGEPEGESEEDPKPDREGSPLPWLIAGAAFAVVGLIVIVLLLVLGGDDEEAPAAPAAEVSVDEIPEGAIAFVAEVPEGEVTQEDFDTALARIADQQGLKQPPAPEDPEYEAARDVAISDLLLPLWIEGEAAERDIAVTDAEVDNRVEQVVKQSFKQSGEFEKFAVEQGFCTEEELDGGAPEDCEGVRSEIEAMLLSEAIQEEVLGGAPESDPQAAEEQQQLASEFQTEFTSRWRLRTACAEGYVIELCSNGPEPAEEPVVPSAATPQAAPGTAAPQAAPGTAPPAAPPTP